MTPSRLLPAPRSRAQAMAARGGALSGRSEPGAARGGRGAGRAGADAGRRRHRQDQGADHPDRASAAHRPRPAERNPRRHLHQQGGARDEGAGGAAAGPDGRGDALARHLPRHRREAAAPPCRTGRAEVELHHPRHRRPGPAAEAADPGREHRREALAGADAGRADRRLEEPRLAPETGARRPRPRAYQPPRHRALRRLSGPAEGAERGRFRRPAAACA